MSFVGLSRLRQLPEEQSLQAATHPEDANYSRKPLKNLAVAPKHFTQAFPALADIPSAAEMKNYASAPTLAVENVEEIESETSYFESELTLFEEVMKPEAKAVELHPAAEKTEAPLFTQFNEAPLPALVSDEPYVSPELAAAAQRELNSHLAEISYVQPAEFQVPDEQLMDAYDAAADYQLPKILQPVAEIEPVAFESSLEMATSLVSPVVTSVEPLLFNEVFALQRKLYQSMMTLSDMIIDSQVPTEDIKGRLEALRELMPLYLSFQDSLRQ